MSVLRDLEPQLGEVDALVREQIHLAALHTEPVVPERSHNALEASKPPPVATSTSMLQHQNAR